MLTHNLIFISLASCSVLLFLSFLVGVCKKDIELIMPSLFIGFLFFIFGWVIAGSILPVNEAEIPVKAKVIKTDFAILLLVSNNVVVTITDYATYKRLEEINEAIIYKQVYTNIYEIQKSYNIYRY